MVLDVGKTLSKLSLWDEGGRAVVERARYNARVEADGGLCLDAKGIEQWAIGVLTEFRKVGPIAAIVPVSHGAAAAIIRDGRLAYPVRDYEDPVPVRLRESYDIQRDSFDLTGSPALPGGLNLGVQLHWLEDEHDAPLRKKTYIVPWPQYWAWRLSGVPASEVTSLGCHTDLWYPAHHGPSALARNRGWWDVFAPLRRADEVLGQLTSEWARNTGLSTRVRVLCGMHDSNAALYGVRGFRKLAGQEVSVVSTGTWFVAMRTMAKDAALDMASLPESRDCLVNVDCESRPVPSARFMGGRELELIAGEDLLRTAPETRVLSELVKDDTMVLPSWVAGVGPYPYSNARWMGLPRTPESRLAAAGIYAALMTDTCLDLIGAKRRIVIEGRFASMELFVRTLATLRPGSEMFIDRNRESSLSYGALRLVSPTLRRPETLVPVAPLEIDLSEYKARWKRRIEETASSRESVR